MCDDDYCDEYEGEFEEIRGDSYGSIGMDGGGSWEDRKAMIDAQKELKIIEEQNSVPPTVSSPEEATNIVEETQVKSLNPDVDIIEPPKPPPMPILLNKLKKMYQNNMYTIQQLKNSENPSYR